MNLLPHNQELCNKIIKKMKKHHDICIVQGTGGGKSFILMYLIITQFKDKKIAIVTPTKDIQDGIKTYKEFKEVKKNVKFFTNHYFNSEERIDEISSEYDVVVVDEVHHIGSDLYGQNLRILKDKMVSQEKYFLGLTATPIRSADKVDVRKFFSAEVTGYGVFDFVQMGLMPQIEYLICEKETIEQAIKDKCREVIDYESSYDLLRDIIESNHRNKWLCYFSSVKDLHNHRKLVKELFPDHRYIEIYAGSEDTSETFKTIGKNEKVVISSVSKLLEGIHLDKMEGVLLFRKVTSLNVFEQILGRLMSIGAKTSPIFVDCTSTASKLLAKMLYVKPENDILPPPATGGTTRDVIRVSLSNSRFFDIAKLQMAMGSSLTFEFRGKIYPSCNECCIQFDVNPSSVLRKSARDNISRQEALEYFLDPNNFIFVFDGVEYESVNQCCKILGISSAKVHERVKEFGMTIEESIQYAVDRKEEMSFTFRGVKYKSFTTCCKEFNIQPSNVMRIVKSQNISKEEALELVLTREKFIYEDKEYESFTDCCNTFGISPNSVNVYAHNHNVSKQEAITHYRKKPKVSKDPYIFNGVEYTSFTACCKSLGIRRNTVKEIAKKENISLDEALLLHYNRKMAKEKPFVFDAVEYSSFEKCCEHYDLRTRTVLALKKRKNCSDEEAIRLSIENKKKYKSKFFYKGREYPSLRQCCLFLEINSRSVEKKSERDGISIEESIKYFLKRKEDKQI